MDMETAKGKPVRLSAKDARQMAELQREVVKGVGAMKRIMARTLKGHHSPADLKVLSWSTGAVMNITEEQGKLVDACLDRGGTVVGTNVLDHAGCYDPDTKTCRPLW